MQAPLLVRRKEETKALKGKSLEEWAKAQRAFLRWTKDKKIFTEEYLQNGKKMYDLFFSEKGLLQGNVLDIGGGWGLFRQWWSPRETDVFIVHDPGLERFLRGPHPLHHVYYERAFNLPMTFVEGFGEDLPYNNETFDTCLVAAALDHCLDPEQVLAEMYRCLKKDGAILVIQHCHSAQPERRSPRPPLPKRVLKHLRYPQRLPRMIYKFLFYRKDPHLHHFLLADITSMLEKVGYSEIRVDVVPTTESVYAFQAKKKKA
ncbi:MAG: class I SAM-dependent methyltransferase [Anaerolineae bacterium]|nr:class I SAM-dependent methyltransferase [Anaerolineae bacterium]